MVLTKTQKFKNAIISRTDGTITEIYKDDEKIYILDKILKEWDGIEGVSITISLNSDVEEDGEVEVVTTIE